jgi:hypothetical protein
MQAERSNFFHWSATIVAIFTNVVFVATNYRGIFSWRGLGVYTIPFYVVGEYVAAILWILGRLKGSSKLRFLFWLALLLPLSLILLLPTVFST